MHLNAKNGRVHSKTKRGLSVLLWMLQFSGIRCDIHAETTTTKTVALISCFVFVWLLFASFEFEFGFEKGFSQKRLQLLSSANFNNPSIIIALMPFSIFDKQQIFSLWHFSYFVELRITTIAFPCFLLVVINWKSFLFFFILL